ncbi:hypothetical protein D5086_021311 [Populus alba]|uniref:Uncharacterized protein n=2 Tax=Populus alba TaxID=43335 RepID=A0A4U5Q1F5_POPAL|nr:hypothetical protein D5086_0000148930 [Populus alba]
MHGNIGEQRDNWNKLLLNSINMNHSHSCNHGWYCSRWCSRSSSFGSEVTINSFISAATGMLIFMNKIQPSQLAEEQRNATRLFKQLYSQIQTTLALRDPTELDVKTAMEKTLALDKDYPLPLLGKMIAKFPEHFEPAVWWPKSHESPRKQHKTQAKNGWSEDLEKEMREFIEVIKRKVSEYSK